MIATGLLMIPLEVQQNSRAAPELNSRESYLWMWMRMVLVISQHWSMLVIQRMSQHPTSGYRRCVKVNPLNTCSRYIDQTNDSSINPSMTENLRWY